MLLFWCLYAKLMYIWIINIDQGMMKQRDIKIKPATIERIKRRLNRGSYAEIAADLGVTYVHVSNVMNGHRYDQRVIFRAVELVKEQEAEVKEKLAEIDL